MSTTGGINTRRYCQVVGIGPKPPGQQLMQGKAPDDGA